MKIKKIFFINSAIIFLLLSYHFVNASCCVSTCSSPDEFNVCKSGESPEIKDCSSFSSCNSIKLNSSDQTSSSDKTSSDKSSTSDKTSSSGSSSTTTTIEFKNPIGVSTLKALLTKLLSTLKSFVIVLSIIFIVIGGLMYIMSGGNEKTITRAKACIAGAVIGLAVVLSAPIFLNEVLKIFGGASDLTTSDLPTSLSLYQVAVNVLSLLLSILGIVAIISLVIGGGMYLTAYGDEKQIETAKRVVKYAVIGLIIALSAIIIVREVQSILGGTSSSSTGIWI